MIWDCAYLDIVHKYTYKQMESKVARLADVYAKRFGVTKGDRVLIYMPMIPEAAFAMLACARIGAIHSVVFGGFASNELSNRIVDCQPKLVVTASCGIEPKGIIRYAPIVKVAISHSKVSGIKILIVQ
jgi:propionyl-CoA synthetase